MFKSLTRVVSPTLPKSRVQNEQKRFFWEYVNMMFNRPDYERIKMLGPDRTCAEWVLRNGGSVVWADGKKLLDYNSLPVEGQQVKKIMEINGTDSGISHYGFPHLEGCTMLKKILLHNASYIDDRALKGLSFAKESLTHVQISQCKQVTDAGLKELSILTKLETLLLFELASVNDLEGCKSYLSSNLPQCKIDIAEARKENLS